MAHRQAFDSDPRSEQGSRENHWADTVVFAGRAVGSWGSVTGGAGADLHGDLMVDQRENVDVVEEEGDGGQ